MSQGEGRSVPRASALDMASTRLPISLMAAGLGRAELVSMISDFFFSYVDTGCSWSPSKPK